MVLGEELQEEAEEDQEASHVERPVEELLEAVGASETVDVEPVREVREAAVSRAGEGVQEADSAGVVVNFPEYLALISILATGEYPQRRAGGRGDCKSMCPRLRGSTVGLRQRRGESEATGNLQLHGLGDPLSKRQLHTRDLCYLVASNGSPKGHETEDDAAISGPDRI